MPKTLLGKWSIGLIAAFFLLFGAFQLLLDSGQRRGDTFFSNPTLSITISLASIFGVCAFFTGIFGIIKSKERAVSVFLTTAIGLFVLWLTLVEIFFTH